MGIAVNGLSELAAKLRAMPQKVEAQVIAIFSKAGKMAVDEARATKTYQDRTYALTASFGYGVVKDGIIVESGGFGSGEGGESGRAYLQELASDVSGLGLIVVAGRDYAVYVERHGFVVLDGGTLGLESEIVEMLNEIDISE